MHGLSGRRLSTNLALLAGITLCACGGSSTKPPADDPGPAADAPAIERPASSLHVHIHTTETVGVQALNLIRDQFDMVDALVDPISQVLRPATHPTWKKNDAGCSEWTFRPASGCPQRWTVCGVPAAGYDWSVLWQDCTGSASETLLLEASTSADGKTGTVWRYPVDGYDRRSAATAVLGWSWDKPTAGVYGTYEIFDPAVSGTVPIATFSRIISTENGHEILTWDHPGVHRWVIDSVGFEQDGDCNIYAWQDGAWSRRELITWTARDTGTWISYDAGGNTTEARSW